MMSDFGEVKLPGSKEIVGYFYSGRPSVRKRLAVLLPPATAVIEPLIKEARTFGDEGVPALILLPPYARKEFMNFSRGPENPEGEIEFWNLNAFEIGTMISEIKIKNGLDSTVLLGKNLGGSYAAYTAVTYSVDSLLAYGSIPSLSRFWLYSQYHVARGFRAGREALIPNFGEMVRPLDLISSLVHFKGKAFLQFGHNDDWFDEEQKRMLKGLPNLRWYPDDHEMGSVEAIQDRLGFVFA